MTIAVRVIQLALRVALVLISALQGTSSALKVRRGHLVKMIVCTNARIHTILFLWLVCSTEIHSLKAES
jgi:hypothetical protein